MFDEPRGAVPASALAVGKISDMAALRVTGSLLGHPGAPKYEIRNEAGYRVSPAPATPCRATRCCTGAEDYAGYDHATPPVVSNGAKLQIADQLHVTGFVYRRRFQIEWGHCDPAGIVFNARFFEFFDRNAWLMVEAALGVKHHDLSKVYDIVGIPLVGSEAKFLFPCAFGDVVDIESRVSEIRRSSFDVAHRIFNGDTLAVEGLEKRVWAGKHPDDPTRMKARAIPAEVIARLRQA